MDELLIDIYRIVADKDGRSAANIKLENIVQDMTDTADIEKMKSNKNELNSLLADAVCIGQDDGFITGFTCAIRLFTQCLVKE